MKHLAYIDDYFKGAQYRHPSTGNSNKDYLDDPTFAEEVAFYLTAQRVFQQQARDEKVARFRKLHVERPAHARSGHRNSPVMPGSMWQPRPS